MTRCFSRIASAVLLLVLASPTRAQITFTAEEFLNFRESGETITSTSHSTDVNDNIPDDDRTEIQALIALRGPNQTWDFTTIGYPNSSTVATTFYSGGGVASLPGAGNFPNATFAFLNDSTATGSSGGTQGYVYGRLTGNDYFTEGIYIPPQDGNDEIVLPQGIKQITFPLTYGTVTTDQKTEQVQGVTMQTTYRAEAVGYGTLITPAGSVQALMIEHKITITMPGFPVPPTEFSTYVWASKEEISAAATYQAVQQGTTVAFASYSTPGTGGSANTAPTVASTVTATATSGAPVDIDVLAGVTDPDDDPLTVTSVTQPAHGTATIVAGGSTRQVGERVRYTADAGFSGTDSFTFTVSDGNGGEATGTVNVTVNPNVATEDDLAAALRLAVAPNPAAHVATLRLVVAESGHATVAVWDALGREVAALHAGPLAAGEHSFALDTGRLAPGVYVARVEAGGKAAVHRLTVVR